MAKPCTPHLIPQAAQLFKLQAANVGGRGALPSRSLGGPRGPFSHVREWPPYSVQRQRRCLPPAPLHCAGTKAALSRCIPLAPVREHGTMYYFFLG